MARITASARPARSPGQPQKAAPRPRRVRRAAEGDVITGADGRSVADVVVTEAVQAARGAKLAALDDIVAKAADPKEAAKQLRAIFEGASPDDAEALRRELLEG